MLLRSLPAAIQSLIDRWRTATGHALLSTRIAWLRWLVPLFALLLVLAHQFVESLWFPHDAAFRFAANLVVYGLLGPLVVWLALGWIKHKVSLKEKAEAELVQAHADLTSLHKNISFLLNVNQRLAQATDEATLAELTLQLPGEVVPSVVSSAMIRFDDHHQPMPIAYRGALDEAMLSHWHQYLSSRPVHKRCETCRVHAARMGEDCPLLQRLPLKDVGGVVCQPLVRNEREFGILGMFLAAETKLTRDERELLGAVTAEISTAFESIRLRTRELAAFYDINETLQLKLDLDGLMERVLTLTIETCNAQAGLIALQEADGSLAPRVRIGDWRDIDWLSLAHPALDSSSGEPIITTVRAGTSLVCAPMMSDDGALGVVVIKSRQELPALRRQTRLLSAIAGQAALLAQNARLYAQLENQAILAERGRLAREMHDGVAQTLGYLKMRARQISRWVAAGQTETAHRALLELADAADDAYLDLRAALDGLRLTPGAQPGADLAAQLRRTAADFEAQSGQTVELSLDEQAGSTLSISAQAHLLRIVQESLTNIRKHANAHRVRLALAASGQRAQLLIEDDGDGFEVSRDQPETHHGLSMMQERAGLLGAELQITSAAGQGTRVSIEWSAKETLDG